MRITTLAAVVSIALASPAAAHEGHDDAPYDAVFKIGKTGEVKFGNDVRFGDRLVKKGKYVVTHRLDGDSHVLVLTATGQQNMTEPLVREIRTRVIPSRDPFKGSALVAEEQRDRSYRVKMVQIAGESGDHVPETSAVQTTAAGARGL